MLGQVRAAAGGPFDLRADRLMRVQLLQLSEQEHVLSMVMHHIVSDGWSAEVLIEEVTKLYESYVHGGSGAEVLAPLPIQYAGYAQWQRQWLQGEGWER